MTLGFVPPSPYWNGRFSSGPVWNEYLPMLLGFRLDSRAVGLSQTNDSKVRLLGIIPMDVPSARNQIAQFQKDNPDFAKSPASNSDIAFLEIGSNEIINSLNKIEDGRISIDSFTDSLSNTMVGLLQQLRDCGFKHVFVVNAPAIDKIPLAKLRSRQQVAYSIVAAYNKKLATKATRWATTAGIRTFGIADLGRFVDLTTSPSVASALGLVDTKASCIGGDALNLFEDDNFINALLKLIINLKDTLLCSDPGTSYFFDVMHPGERAHRLFAYYIQELVKARFAGSTYELSAQGLIELIRKHRLNSPVPHPARV
ncbi:hypothetical protein GGI12_002221 [Dipsacomyces acuminosporus]|nr:hypothetical protein GGI12_002221 [Dipsacomyces acuminosporus]